MSEWSTLAEITLPASKSIAGGFPCTDISNAGQRAGINGEQSGLWSEYARVVRELRPNYVIVENVSALLARGMERVLGDLVACGYDCEWDCIPAAAVGAHHRRDRIFLVAYANRDGLRKQSLREPRSGSATWSPIHGSARLMADSDSHGLEGRFEPDASREPQPVSRDEGLLADSDGNGWEQSGRSLRQGEPDAAGNGEAVSDANGRRRQDERIRRVFHGKREALRDHADRCYGETWAVEPNVGRVAHGVPKRVDRLRGLGNAVVPQVMEFIGRQVIDHAS